jgi:hypothetical protein
MLTNDILLMELGQKISNELAKMRNPVSPEDAVVQNANIWRTIMGFVMVYIVSNAQVTVTVPVMPAVTPSGPGTAGPGTGAGTIV